MFLNRALVPLLISLITAKMSYVNMVLRKEVSNSNAIGDSGVDLNKQVLKEYEKPSSDKDPIFLSLFGKEDSYNYYQYIKNHLKELQTEEFMAVYVCKSRIQEGPKLITAVSILAKEKEISELNLLENPVFSSVNKKLEIFKIEDKDLPFDTKDRQLIILAKGAKIIELIFFKNRDLAEIANRDPNFNNQVHGTDYRFKDALVKFINNYSQLTTTHNKNLKFSAEKSVITINSARLDSRAFEYSFKDEVLTVWNDLTRVGKNIGIGVGSSLAYVGQGVAYTVGVSLLLAWEVTMSASKNRNSPNTVFVLI